MDKCPEYWPLGLRAGLLIACNRHDRHTGSHLNESGDLQWSGKMTDEERETLNASLTARVL